MVSRVLPTSASASITGADYMDAVSASVADLYDKSFIKLSSIGGTANAITATATPAIVSGLVDGMGFVFKPTATNTNSVTLAIGSETAKAVVNTDGSALSAGTLQSGWTYAVIYDSATTSFVVIGSSTLTKINDYQLFTASGTWTKPANCPDYAIVRVEMWGAGGGGADTGFSIRSGGGGGGSYAYKIFRANELSATVAVSVGAGGAKGAGSGASGSAGGNTTFGAYLTAYGGGGGYGSTANAAGFGGGGASTTTVGSSASSGGAGAETGLGYGHHGGSGGDGSDEAQSSVFGGGGGGGYPASGAGQNGGSSYWAGGGGAGYATASGGANGTSVMGGNGGSAGAAGSAPGGGGGAFAAGARGECRVTVTG